MSKLDYEPRLPHRKTAWRDVFDTGCALLVLAALVFGSIGLAYLLNWAVHGC